jgi:lipid-binding SYLF domain-containing protein
MIRKSILIVCLGLLATSAVYANNKEQRRLENSGVVMQEIMNIPWGSPAMMALEGGSVGFQIGGQATDLVLLIMNDRGAQSILSSKVKLGGDASIAAGPVGRDAAANTDAFMRAEILSYSRTRGVFAGVSLEGSTLRPDDGANEDVYGRKLTSREIVFGGAVGVPPSGRHLVRVLDRNSPYNESKQSAGNK